MHLFHSLLVLWFEWVRDWGYVGIFILMAMESSIFPVPSEIVIPPAAYYATQGKFTYLGVVLAGILGSLFGSWVTYWAARFFGRPLVLKYGKRIGIKEHQVAWGEVWLIQKGALSLGFCRLIPVIRHVISIPAGILRMRMFPFITATTIGAGIWCIILAYFGVQVLGADPMLLQSPEAFIHQVKSRTLWIVFFVLACFLAYFFTFRKPVSLKKF